MFKTEKKFLEFLTYQIAQKARYNAIIDRIPAYISELEKTESKIEKMQKNYEEIHRREVYRSLVAEFGALIRCRQ
jgi:hypothetical protein